MADCLSVEERRLIEEAMKSGKVQRCPAGMRALVDKARFNPKTNRIETGLTKDAVKEMIWGGARRRQPNAVIARRRAEVLKLAQQGKARGAIAAELGLAQHTVTNDLIVLRDKGML